MNLLKSLFCSHKHQTFVRNIYGDEIIRAGYKRSIWQCDACGAIRGHDTPHNDGAVDALKALEARKDAAYLERNQVVAALAHAYPSGTSRTAIEGWPEDWHGCVYIDLPTGQASWHYHESQAHLFSHLPPYPGSWDGHSTEEKYGRLARLAYASDVRTTSKQAEAPQQWIERWHGSGGKSGMEGWSILDAASRKPVAYLGREVGSEAVSAIVMAHNTTCAAAQAAPSELELGNYEADSGEPHPILMELSAHDNPCVDTADALARITALKAEVRRLLSDSQDAARWRWLSDHMEVSWIEGKFTSLVRIVSERWRQAINASVDRMMDGDWSDADAARAAVSAQSGFVLINPEDFLDIIRDIGQHIDQGVASERKVAAERPSYGTGLCVHIANQMAKMSRLIAAAPQALATEGVRDGRVR